MIYYKSGYKYQLVRDYAFVLAHITLPPNTGSLIKGHSSIGVCSEWCEVRRSEGRLLLQIRGGYCWDGPSGPSIDTKNFMRGSLAHDALYQLIRLGLLGSEQRALADRELYTICREDGMNRLRAAYVYRCVRWFGKGAANPARERPILTAP